MKKVVLSLVILFAICIPLYAQNNISDTLQNISVTVKAGNSSGSGVIVTRDLKENENSDKKPVNFIITAGHVVDSLKKTNKIVDSSSGQERILVEFDYPKIMQIMVEDGKRVGEVNLDCKVLRFSDSEIGEDLAVLMVLKRGFTDASATFYLDNEDIKLGTKVLHVGSFLGDFGSNSMSNGILSQVGRMINNKEYSQFSCAGFPGSSGGGIFLEDGRYIGTLVRGAGESFVLAVPNQRMRSWMNKVGMDWLLDANIEPPTLEKVLEGVVDDSAMKFHSNKDEKDKVVEVENKSGKVPDFLIYKD